MKKLLAFVLAAAMFTTGCSTAWITTFDQYAAQIAPAVSAVISILQLFGVGVPAGLGQKINTDVQLVTTLTNDFANASASSQPGIRAQIVAAEATLNQDIAQLLQVAQVSDKNTQAKITALIGLIESLIQAAFNALPQNTSTQATFEKAGQLSDAQALAESFATSFNKILTAKTGNHSVDLLTPKLQVHKHGKFVRTITLGFAH